MSPKKKSKKREETGPVQELDTQISGTSIPDDLNLLTDLNEQFFAVANKIIEHLAIRGRGFEASKIKRYTDIIFNLHRFFAEELRKNEEMRPKIVDADNKLRLALDITVDTKNAMDQLQQSLSNAWKENDASMMREQLTQEKMQELILKCEDIDQKQIDKDDDTAEFGNLAKYKNIILRERDRLSGEVIDIEKRLQFQRYYSEALEYINKNQDDNTNKLNMRVRVLETEQATLQAKIRNYMTNLEDARDSLSKLASKYEHMSKEFQDTTYKLDRKNADFDQQKLLLDKHRNANILHTKQAMKYEEDIAELRKQNNEMENLIRGMRLEDKAKTNAINNFTKKLKKASQDASAMATKMYKLNRHNNQLEQDIVRLKNNINALEKDVLSWNYKFDDLRRMKEHLQRERDSLRSDIHKLNDTIADLKHTIMVQNNKMDNLNLDINKLNVKLDEAKILISKAEKDRNEMAQEVESLNEKIEYYQEQLKIKSDQVTDLTEKLHTKHVQLISVRKQLEIVHSDKMALQRNLETCTQERDNFRVLQTKTSHQIAQLTNEIIANQTKITQLNLMIERLNSDKKELQTELKNKENMLSRMRKDIRDLKNKNESLLKTIGDDELKFMKISQELDELRKEKNLVGLQMVRRNDEIVMLKEKLDITQSALDQGQTQYNQRIEDIRLLKVEIINLQTERECLKRAIKSTADMREELIRLQRALNQERIKVRSLTEDAKTPTGVHRWRILKGEDPNKFQLLQKVQMLQRRNLQQEIEKANLGSRLKEARESADALKRAIAHLPTPEIKTKLVETQRAHRQQTKKMKALAAELAIDKIELRARECIIGQFKRTFKLTKNEICFDAETLQRLEHCNANAERLERVCGGQDATVFVDHNATGWNNDSGVSDNDAPYDCTHYGDSEDSKYDCADLYVSKCGEQLSINNLPYISGAVDNNLYDRTSLQETECSGILITHDSNRKDDEANF